MLYEKSTEKNKKSQYVCDSCNKIITREERVLIDKNNFKKYDLCEDCWRKIRIIVEKHKLKRSVSK